MKGKRKFKNMPVTTKYFLGGRVAFLVPRRVDFILSPQKTTDHSADPFYKSAQGFCF